MNRMLISIVILLIVVAGQAQPSLLSAEKNKVDALLKSMYADTLPGAAVAIMEQNQVVYEGGYGIDNIVTKATITPVTSFNIASLTKQFTALAILQLEEEHRLSRADKISRFFTDLNKKAAGAITVQQLLTHSSGIVDHYNYTDTRTLRHAHNKDVYEAIRNIDSTYFAPGTQFRYSNTAYCLLALIIERVSGMPYNSYMEKNIFKPAGMLHTTIWSETAMISQPATGYEWDSTQHRFVQSGAGEHIFFSTEGDGGIYTSVADYTKWFAALQSAKVFSRLITNKARIMQFSIDKTQQIGYGFGWFAEADNKNKRVYHSGSNGGFRTFSFTIPAEGFLVVIFSNRDDIDLEELVQKINDILHPSDAPFIKIEALTS